MILRRAECPNGKTCPTIERVDGGFDLIGFRRDDPNLPSDEARIHWPDNAQMLPELTDLHVADLDAYFEQHRRTPGDLLRVQTLRQYSVASDDEDFRRYVAGESEPQSSYRGTWFKELRNDTAAGRVWRNVHVVDLPLNDYLRYQFEWGYIHNVRAGQHVRVLDTMAHPEAAEFFRAGDFYVFESERILHMRYAEDGRFLGAAGSGASSTAGFVALAELAWRLATPFDDWWVGHPEYHRTSQ